MKSKKIILIFAVFLILIVIILRNRSQKIPSTTYPPVTQNTTVQNGTEDQNTTSIDTDLQSLDNIVGRIDTEDFGETTLDGIE